MSIFNVIAGLVKPVGDIIDNVTTTDEERLELKVKFAEVTKDVEIKLTEYASTLAEQQAKIILAEAQGSWLQANWRPMLMCIFGLIVLNNYLLFPYLSMFTKKVVVLNFPDAFWNLLTVGVGGYIVGRSAEKGIKSWRNNNNE